jgi:hypothetical protein
MQDPVAHLSGLVSQEKPDEYTFIGYRDAPDFSTRTALFKSRKDKMLSELEVRHNKH